MKVRFLDTPAIGWLSFALWLVLLFLGEVFILINEYVPPLDAVVRVLCTMVSRDQFYYVLPFLPQLVFALVFASAIAEEIGDRRHRAVLISFWGVSFALMLLGVLIPLCPEGPAVSVLVYPMMAVLPLLFFSGGVYLMTRKRRFPGAVICALGLAVWMAPAFWALLVFK